MLHETLSSTKPKEKESLVRASSCNWSSVAHCFVCSVLRKPWGERWARAKGLNGRHASCMTTIKRANPWCPTDSDPDSLCQGAWAGEVSAEASCPGHFRSVPALHSTSGNCSYIRNLPQVPTADSIGSSSDSFRGGRQRAEALILMPDTNPGKLLAPG